MKKTFFLILLILALLLTACSPASAPSAPEEPAFDYAVGEAPAGYRSAGDSLDFEDQSGIAAERIVIKDATLEIIVKDPPKSLDTISKLADQMGGYVVSANLWQNRLASGAEIPRASVTIRVPAERLDEAIERIEAESDRIPQNKNVNSQDVTREYTDLQSRLRNLEAAEAQLAEIMAEARKTDEVLQVYEQLTRVREQIEVIKGQIQYYEQSARLSSIKVEIIAEEAVQPLTVAGWKPVGVARNALQALINAVQFLATAAIWVVLVLIPVLFVIFLPVYLFARIAMRWRGRRKEGLTPPPPPSPSGA